MSEVGSALPYVSALRITKRPTQRWQATGYQNRDGQDLYQQVQDLPGIECEITVYMGSVKGPSIPFKFPLKKFFEDALAELVELPLKSDPELAAIDNITATLNRSDIVWCETVLLAGQLPTLLALWADVYSDALDEFPKWAEENRGAGGIELFLKEMQWDIRVPFEASKTVELNVGLFLKENEAFTTSIHKLLFEDASASLQRMSYRNQLQQRINEIATAVGNLPEGPSSERTQLEQQLTAYQNELSQRDAVDVTTIGALLGNTSVQTQLPALLLAIIGTLKTTRWPNLDMDLVQERMALTLAGIS